MYALIHFGSTGAHGGGFNATGSSEHHQEAGGRKQNPGNKWQAQISSGFDALLGFASSELDRSKEMRRKSVDSTERSPSSSYGFGPDNVVLGANNKAKVTPHAPISSSAPESALRAALSGELEQNNSRTQCNTSTGSTSIQMTNKIFTDTKTGVVQSGSSPKRGRSPPPNRRPGSRSSSTESQPNKGNGRKAVQKSRSPSPPTKDSDSGRQSPQDYSKYDKHFKKKFFMKDLNKKKQNSDQSNEAKDAVKETKKEKRYGKFKWKGKDWEKRNSDKSDGERNTATPGTTESDKDNKKTENNQGNTSRSSSTTSCSGNKDNNSNSSERSSAFTPQPPRASSSGNVSQSPISMSTPPPPVSQFSFGSGVGLPANFGGLRSAGFGEPPQLARSSPHLTSASSGHPGMPPSIISSGMEHSGTHVLVDMAARSGGIPAGFPHPSDRSRLPPHLRPADISTGRLFEHAGRMPAFGDMAPVSFLGSGVYRPQVPGDLSHRRVMTPPGGLPPFSNSQ